VFELFGRLNGWGKFLWLPFILTIFSGTNSALGDSFSSLNKKGNRAYEKGWKFLQKGEKDKAEQAWEEALKYYRDAEIEKPESPELSYNLGNVMYQQERYQDAMERYLKALSSDKIEHQAWAYYNLGNTFYRSGKYPEAIQAYQKCLELTPDDEDAKYNLEFVRKKMKEMLDKELQRQQQNQKQKQNKSQKQPQPQPDRQQKQQEEKQTQPSQPEEQRKEQKRMRKQTKPQEGMTKEDAERILNALKDDEKELLKKQKRVPRGFGKRRGKDW